MKTIREKTTFTVSVALLTILIVLYLVLRVIIGSSRRRTEDYLMAGFAKVETKNARRNILRINDAIKMHCRNLSLKAADWAQWDDTYRYMYDRNHAYASSNLTPAALSALQINMIAIVDTGGKPLHCMGFNMESSQEVDIIGDFRRHITPGSPLLRHEGDTGISKGIVLMPEHAMMVTSRPVMSSTGRGPSRGSLMFGRYLDDRFFRELSHMTHLTVDCFNVDDTVPSDVAAALNAMVSGDSIMIVPANDSLLTGYIVLRDIYGKKAVCLRMTSDRDIYRQGTAILEVISDGVRITTALLLLSIFLTGLILAMVIVTLMDKLVLRRLDTIARRTLAIGEDASFSGRLPVKGTDEICSLARSVNGMLEALELSVEIIRHRDEEAGVLMANVPIGLCSLDESLRIRPHYSRVLTTMFGVSDCASMDIFTLLDITAADKEDLALYLSLLRERPLSEMEMTDLNPCDELHYVTRGQDIRLQVQFHLMELETGGHQYILVIIKDVTEEKRLALQVDTTRKENMQLKMISENPELFREFLIESRRIIANVQECANRLQQGTVDYRELQAVFRGVHTIKGVTVSFGLVDVTRIAGELEEYLTVLLRNADFGEDEKKHLTELIGGLAAEYEKVTGLSHGLLGVSFDEYEPVIRVTISAIDEIIALIHHRNVSESSAGPPSNELINEIAARISRLKRLPAYQALARSLRIVPDLITRLNKNCRLVIHGKECMLSYETATVLNGALVHLLRNAIDHGIEAPEERIAAGKQEWGEVKLELICTGETLSLILSDDGRGLDPDAIKEAAVKGGFFTGEDIDSMSSLEVQQIILTPGFTTAGHINDVSGRGVGLDAVVTLLEEHNGTVEISSEYGKGTVVHLTVPECNIPV